MKKKREKPVCHKQRSPCVPKLECLPAATRNPGASTKTQSSQNRPSERQKLPAKNTLRRLSFRYEGKVKSCPDKQKLEVTTTEPAKKC